MCNIVPSDVATEGSQSTADADVHVLPASGRVFASFSVYVLAVNLNRSVTPEGKSQLRCRVDDTGAEATEHRVCKETCSQ